MTADMPRVLDRKEAVPALVGDPADFLLISGLAGTGKDIGALTGPFKDYSTSLRLGFLRGAADSSLFASRASSPCSGTDGKDMPWRLSRSKTASTASTGTSTDLETPRKRAEKEIYSFPISR